MKTNEEDCPVAPRFARRIESEIRNTSSGTISGWPLVFLIPLSIPGGGRRPARDRSPETVPIFFVRLRCLRSFVLIPSRELRLRWTNASNEPDSNAVANRPNVVLAFRILFRGLQMLEHQRRIDRQL